MTLDAQESERLWRTLGQMNAQLGTTHELASDTALRLERFERTLIARSEFAGRQGAKKGARLQGALVAALISLAGAIANYYSAQHPSAPSHAAP